MIRSVFLVSFLFITFKGSGQDFFLLKDPGEGSILLDSGWTYRILPDTNFQVASTEEFPLKPIQPSLDIHLMPSEITTGVGYMVLRIKVSPELRKLKLALSIQQSVASEIYFNGILPDSKALGIAR